MCTNRSSSQSPLLPYGFSAPSNHYNHRLRLRACIRLNVCSPRVGNISSHSASVDLPSVRLPAAFFQFLLPFSRFSDFPPARATFPDLMVGLDQICSSVFFEILRPSSNHSLLLQGSSTFFDLPRPSITFGFAQFALFCSSSFIDLRSLFSIVSDLPQASFRLFLPSATFTDF
jgi:hypothetical protein